MKSVNKNTLVETRHIKDPDLNKSLTSTPPTYSWRRAYRFSDTWVRIQRKGSCPQLRTNNLFSDHGDPKQSLGTLPAPALRRAANVGWRHFSENANFLLLQVLASFYGTVSSH
jgi:hypothetical protein